MTGINFGTRCLSSGCYFDFTHMAFQQYCVLIKKYGGSRLPLSFHKQQTKDDVELLMFLIFVHSPRVIFSL